MTEEVRASEPILETHSMTWRPETVSAPINGNLPSLAWKVMGPTGETITFLQGPNRRNPSDYFMWVLRIAVSYASCDYQKLTSDLEGLTTDYRRGISPLLRDPHFDDDI